MFHPISARYESIGRRRPMPMQPRIDDSRHRLDPRAQRSQLIRAVWKATGGGNEIRHTPGDTLGCPQHETVGDEGRSHVRLARASS